MASPLNFPELEASKSTRRCCRQAPAENAVRWFNSGGSSFPIPGCGWKSLETIGNQQQNRYFEHVRTLRRLGSEFCLISCTGSQLIFWGTAWLWLWWNSPGHEMLDISCWPCDWQRPPKNNVLASPETSTQSDKVFDVLEKCNHGKFFQLQIWEDLRFVVVDVEHFWTIFTVKENKNTQKSVAMGWMGCIGRCCWNDSGQKKRRHHRRSFVFTKPTEWLEIRFGTCVIAPDSNVKSHQHHSKITGKEMTRHFQIWWDLCQVVNMEVAAELIYRWLGNCL